MEKEYSLILPKSSRGTSNVLTIGPSTLVSINSGLGSSGSFKTGGIILDSSISYNSLKFDSL